MTTKLTTEELQHHTEELWRLCYEYCVANQIDDKTTGVLIVSELVIDPTTQPAVCVQYATGPKQAAILMARCAAAELKKAGS